MINDLDRSIEELLTIELPDVKSGQVQVAFEPPNRDWRRSGPALNFFLYDLRENAELRQHQLAELSQSNGSQQRENGMVTQARTPLRIDCFYIVTAWGETPSDEHRLLSQCMMALARYPVLNFEPLLQARVTAAQSTASVDTTTSLDERLEKLNENKKGDFLHGTLQKEDAYEIRTRIASHDVMTNPAEIWGSLENTMKAGFSYVVNLPLHPWEPFDTPEVESVRIRFTPPDAQFDPDRPDEDFETQLSFGGTVRNILGHDEPIPGVDIQIEESGLQTTTDDHGHFYFNRILFSEKEFTIVAKHPNAPPYRKTIKIPTGKDEIEEDDDDGEAKTKIDGEGFKINISMALDKVKSKEQQKTAPSKVKSQSKNKAQAKAEKKP